jgi:hypothetical protein
MNSRYCSICKKHKPASEFYNKPRGGQKNVHGCKLCIRQNHAEKNYVFHQSLVIRRNKLQSIFSAFELGKSYQSYIMSWSIDTLNRYIEVSTEAMKINIKDIRR